MLNQALICRYKIDGLVVDIMPTNPDVLGFSNQWYADGVTKSVIYPIDERQTIRVLSAPYFIATKLEAFKSFRHGRDPRMNSDFEDIIYLFDNRRELINEINQSPLSIRLYLREEISVLLSDAYVYENVYAQLEPRTASQRAQRILKIWESITDQ